MFKNWKSQELKENLLSNITSLINEQNKKIEHLNEKITQQNSTISVYKIMLMFWKKIDVRCDELEQYSRRQYLRIEGIVKPEKEKVENVTNLVQECFTEAKLDTPDNVLDRAHRTGPIYKDESNNNV